ncbi:hypothetical protein CAOG_01173 [Capsaspora owczarzaki ATCC 30864]|uniref:hypothetical protein n=1 Tax=Capsaspora owczarzaki (strain ATCC 30864) TaxID=595528 RepID=UPI00035238F5|nr:hypothetical protein CAOG_01173 [Capsaspora owczarzaki ATCC 30864]|eukprot:XP_004366044.2 hypothetical protein CAOG_01173 [Capsaspora owczarzaki ATCC 30864]
MPQAFFERYARFPWCYYHWTGTAATFFDEDRVPEDYQRAQPPLKRIHDWLQVWLTLQTGVAIASAVCPLTGVGNGTKLAIPRAASNSKALHHDSMAFEYV